MKRNRGKLNGTGDRRGIIHGGIKSGKSLGAAGVLKSQIASLSRVELVPHKSGIATRPPEGDKLPWESKYRVSNSANGVSSSFAAGLFRGLFPSSRFFFVTSCHVSWMKFLAISSIKWHGSILSSSLFNTRLAYGRRIFVTNEDIKTLN